MIAKILAVFALLLAILLALLLFCFLSSYCPRSVCTCAVRWGRAADTCKVWLVYFTFF